MNISLVVPLWNEENNVEPLIKMLTISKTFRDNPNCEAILVNNGSTDKTGALLEQFTETHPWIRTVQINSNLNYGGGIYEGSRYAKNDFIAFIPGDLQYLSDDLDKVVERLETMLEEGYSKEVLVKGKRTTRQDSNSFQAVSSTYTKIANFILNLGVQDVNGLPKLFHRSLLNHLPSIRMATFVFDAQLIYVAKNNSWRIEEVDVVFYARRSGVSSWSGKRLQVYLRSFFQLLKVRFLRKREGIPMKSML